MKTIASAILLLVSAWGCGREESPIRVENGRAPWITGFYSAQNGVLPISSIPWSKYTHILHFAAAPGIDGNGNGNGAVELHWLSQAEINQIVPAAHTAGKKVLVTIKDNDNYLSAFGQSTAPDLIASYVSNIVSFINTSGYDGVDIDWEQNIDVSQYNDLLMRLREAMPAKTITMDAGDWGGLESVAASSQSVLDQINVMCYDMDNGSNCWWLDCTWHNAALLRNGQTHKRTCENRVRAFTRKGVERNKIGIGVPFYGRRWTGATLPQKLGKFQSYTVPYRTLVTDTMRWQSAYMHYDAHFKANFLSIPSLNEFISYNGLQFIQDAVTWHRSEGFGGFMTFTVDYEYLSSQTGDARYPLSTALCQDVFGTCP